MGKSKQLFRSIGVYSVLFFLIIFSFPTKSAMAADFQLSGKVTNSSGTGIENAEVSVTDSGSSVVGTATTDQLGDYSISLDSGTYDIAVTPPNGSGFGSAVTVSRSISQNTTINFVLAPSGVVNFSGYIYDAEGGPLPSQDIKLTLTTSPFTVTETSTNSSGFYSINIAPGTYSINLRASRVHPLRSWSLKVPDDFNITVPAYSLTQSRVLDMTLPAKSVVVHVQDESGNSAVDTGIRVVLSGGSIQNIQLAPGVIASGPNGYNNDASYTDASGNTTIWLFANSSGTKYTFNAFPNAPFANTTVSNIVITGNTTQTIVLPTPVSFSGHIYDAGGVPLRSQDIKLTLTSAPFTVVETSTNTAGYYSTNVLPGTYSVNLRAGFIHAQRGASVQVPDNFNITVPSYTLSQNTVLDMTFPAKLATIHIQDVAGNAISDVGVRAALNGGSIQNIELAPGFIASGTGGYNESSYTGTDGNAPLWLFANSSGTSYTFNILPNAPFANTTVSNVQVTSALSQTVTLSSPVSLSGHIYDAQGNGVPSQQVTLTLTTAPFTAVQAVTNSTGAYSVNALSGTYSMNLQASRVHPLRGQSIATPDDFNITVPSYTLSQNTVLDMTLPAKLVTMHIQNSLGDSISNVSVRAVLNSSPIQNIEIAPGLVASGSNGYNTDGSYTGIDGNAPLWLFANSVGTTYTFNISPDAPLANFSLSNVTITDNQTEVVSLQSTLPIITTSSLAETTAGAVYNETLQSIDGVAPINWDISSGSLPAGLSLNVSGGISGTSTTDGTYNFTVRATGANGGSSTKNLGIIVHPAPSIETTSLPSTTATSSYSQTLSVIGGISPFIWSVSAGTLPTGLSLNSLTGIISGTASSSGSSPFTVEVTDSNGATVSQELTITVYDVPAITTTNLEASTVGVSYTKTLSATGGSSPLNWSIESGSLPSGLSLNSETGGISGTPGTADTSNFTVKVTDSNGVSATQALTILVNPVVVITTSGTLAGATIGASYSQVISATGGTNPLTWSLSLGVLPTGLSLNTGTGEISGTATTDGSYDFTIQATDANGSIATQDLTIIVSLAPVIQTSSLAQSTLTASYTQALAVSGGTPTLTWDVSVGNLPDGLSLDSGTGVISGTPTTVGSTTFTVQTTDANNVSDTQDLTIVVNNAPSITTTSLPNGIVGATYAQFVGTSGGTQPLSWSVESGSLPQGLELNIGTGEISGTPTTTGSFNFTIKVTDSNGVVSNQAFSLTIDSSIAIVTSGNLPDVTVGGAYSQTVSATGGTAPLTWSIASGALPAGISLDSATGTFSGVPTTAGVYNFTLQVTDASNQSATQAQSINVSPAPIITTTTLPQTALGNSYSQSLQKTGGTPNFTWSVSVGALPAGLTLNSVTGVISGTPTAPGTTGFTINLTDGYGIADTQALSITVNQALSIKKNNLPDKKVGHNYSQSITTQGGVDPLIWSVASGSLPTGLTLDSATGVLSGVPTVVGIYNFTIQVTDAANSTDSKAYTVEIKP